MITDARTIPLAIDPSELRDLLDRHADVTVLDVRPDEERAEWHIPGSLHIDAYEALKAGDSNALAGLDIPKGRRVVTVCGAGRTSQIAATLLRDRGVIAQSLAGGMKAWSLAWNTARVPVAPSPAEVIQIRRTGKGCLSYLGASDGEAAVIDASVEPAVYRSLAGVRGWTITHVLDTHIHADHLSRSRELAAQTGATLHLPETDRVLYSYAPIRDGDMLLIGRSQLQALGTPGHTPESTCYLLDDTVIFTGDTMFPTGIGRPDLDADPAQVKKRAHRLYDSLHKLLTLSPDVLVLAGHTSHPVPFDTTPIAAPLSSVRASVPMLALPENAFVDAILSRIPPTPPNYGTIVALNENGDDLTGDPTDLEAGANRCAVS
jgi:glyoxylase-like metal-dependent hydrolase (beta-lactamase superfamily II)/rhodanese-related sulfurtransferase